MAMDGRNTARQPSKEPRVRARILLPEDSTNKGNHAAGHYLLWLDRRALGLDDMTLRHFMREKARVGLDDGFLFGAGSSGFQRMNIACHGACSTKPCRGLKLL